MPTPAELAVLHRLAQPGSTIVSVARELGISTSAAEKRLHRLYRRLGVTSALQAYARLREDFRTFPD